MKVDLKLAYLPTSAVCRSAGSESNIVIIGGRNDFTYKPFSDLERGKLVLYSSVSICNLRPATLQPLFPSYCSIVRVLGESNLY